MARARRTPSAARRVAGAVAVAAALGASAGCSYINPITTAEPYAASDGFRVSVGDQVRGENLMVLTSGEGEPGVLLGALINTSDAPTTVTLEIGGDAPERLGEIPLDAKQTVLLSPETPERDAVTSSAPSLGADLPEVGSVPAPPGGLVTLVLKTPEAGAVEVQIPVLDDTLPEYADTLPTRSG